MFLRGSKLHISTANCTTFPANTAGLEASPPLREGYKTPGYGDRSSDKTRSCESPLLQGALSPVFSTFPVTRVLNKFGTSISLYSLNATKTRVLHWIPFKETKRADKSLDRPSKGTTGSSRSTSIQPIPVRFPTRHTATEFRTLSEACAATRHIHNHLIYI